LKLGIFKFGDRAFRGVVEEDRVYPLEGRGFYDVGELQTLPPVRPGKIVALALNYRAHAAEMKKPLPPEPLIFLKPPSAVIGHGDTILLPAMSQRVDYEGEMGVVIGKRARGVSLEEALDYVMGYTCFNDVTARDLQSKDGLFARAKGFDTFAVLGPWMETCLDPSSLNIRACLNGQVVQGGNTSDLIFDVPHLISFISCIMTLEPGDVIATGTPPGVGSLSPGDKVEVEIEGIGKLTNSVAVRGW
jgi:2-keto-4-pentenoate hydratase/2-oxohepta-3-ene-1,7-dioic acid hydratase in catechol pathway